MHHLSEGSRPHTAQSRLSAMGRTWESGGPEVDDGASSTAGETVGKKIEKLCLLTDESAGDLLKKWAVGARSQRRSNLEMRQDEQQKRETERGAQKV